MKELSGSAGAPASAPVDRCVTVLADVENYPLWYPAVVREVRVLDRDGDQASRVQATLHVSVGPISRDLSLMLEVVRQGAEVTLTRVNEEASDSERFVVHWRVEPGNGADAHIDLHLDAALDVPRLVPLGGVGDALAEGFVAAAVKAVEQSAT
jgi:ribosome-associated toxin RatA of RatAB toxin-antitoxin module